MIPLEAQKDYRYNLDSAMTGECVPCKAVTRTNAIGAVVFSFLEVLEIDEFCPNSS